MRETSNSSQTSAKGLGQTFRILAFLFAFALYGGGEGGAGAIASPRPDSIFQAAIRFFSGTSTPVTTFSVAPSSISTTNWKTISLTITNLNKSEAVVLERFLDLNSSGTIDSADLMLQRFQLADGFIPYFNWVRNVNVPCDDDGFANSQILAHLELGGELAKVAGAHLFRLTSHSGAITKPVSITQPNLAQAFTGKVFWGKNPLTNAVVCAYDIYGSFVCGTVASSAGAYTLAAKPGDYILLATLFNRSAIGARTPITTLKAGITNTLNLTNISATRIISGTVREQVGNKGIPGVQIAAISQSGFVAYAVSDQAGAFTIQACPDSWTLSIAPVTLCQLGYATPTPIPVDTTSGNVIADFDVPVTDAFFYGTVTNLPNVSFSKLQVLADDSGFGQYTTCSITDSNGDFSLACVGQLLWRSWLEPGPLAQLGFVSKLESKGSLLDQAIPITITPSPVTARLKGRVMLDTNGPAAGLRITADQGNAITCGVTDANGNYDIGIISGDWNINIDPNFRNRTYVVPQPYISGVADNTTNIAYLTLRSPSAKVFGSLFDTDGDPIPNVPITVVTSTDAGLGFGFYSFELQTDMSGFFFLETFEGLWDVQIPTLYPYGYFDIPTASVQFHSGSNRLDLVAQPMPELTILTTNLPPAKLNEPYSFQLQATGGGLPYFWFFDSRPDSGSFPNGITLDTNGTGRISGISTNTARTWFIVSLLDGAGAILKQTYSFRVVEAPSLAFAPGSKPNTVTLNLRGHQTNSYSLQSATNILGPWQTVSTNTLNASGSTNIQFTPTNSQLFYRAMAR